MSLRQDTVVDGAIMDAPQVANAISRIFDNEHVKTKNVATSVSGHSVIVKRVPLPLMSERSSISVLPSRSVTMSGEEDVAVTPARSRKLLALQPGMRFVSIPKAGHTSSIENPEAITAALVDHFQSLS